MNKEVLISIFNRDYSWIKKLNKDIRVSLYRKGDRQLLKPNEIFLSPNVGRDVHTFFSHLFERYYSLSDYTFTCQDYFDDHVNNYIYIMNSNRMVWNEEAKQIIDNECWFFNTDHGFIHCEKDGSPHHPGLNIEDMWYRLFKTEMPDQIQFTAAGHFCISANQVRRRPQQFYKKIVDILSNEHHSPWIIERLEGYIFDSNYDIVDC